MISLLFLRHGRTDWNDRKRIQGHCDVDLNDRGKAELMARQLPAQWSGVLWLCSPLQRAVHSAELLGASQIRCDALLKEMYWGDWEGRTLASLREELGQQMRDNEARGIDFRPDGGESPREVRARLQRWLVGLVAGGADTPDRYVVMTHKGMLRAALSLATGWPMVSAFKPKVEWSYGHEFEVDANARLTLKDINVPLLEMPSVAPSP